MVLIEKEIKSEIMFQRPAQEGISGIKIDLFLTRTMLVEIICVLLKSHNFGFVTFVSCRYNFKINSNFFDYSFYYSQLLFNILYLAY